MAENIDINEIASKLNKGGKAAEEAMEDYSYLVGERFEKINERYIQKVCKHINEIGQLQPSDLHILEQIQKADANVDEIRKEILKQTNKTVNELTEIYNKSAKEYYKDCSKFFEATHTPQVPFSKNLQAKQYLETIGRQTANTFVNLSSTTLPNLNYKNLIDTAVQSVTSNIGTLQGEVANVVQTASKSVESVNKLCLKQVGNSLRVVYNSGITRRLDSAVRMNVMGGIRKYNREYRKMIGEQYGADGVEIDAHGMCAPDHQHCQGKQYSLKKFDLLNGELKRQIGDCNCTHNVEYIVLGVSEPTYSNEELKQMKDYSNEKIEINGKEYTRYECSQAMRRIETEMRYCKDDITAARQFTNDAKMQKMLVKRQERLKELKKSYNTISDKAGITKDLRRASSKGYTGKATQSVEKKVVKEISQKIDINSVIHNKYKDDMDLFYSKGTDSEMKALLNHYKSKVGEDSYIFKQEVKKVGEDRARKLGFKVEKKVENKVVKAEEKRTKNTTKQIINKDGKQVAHKKSIMEYTNSADEWRNTSYDYGTISKITKQLEKEGFKNPQNMATHIYNYGAGEFNSPGRNKVSDILHNAITKDMNEYISKSPKWNGTIYRGISLSEEKVNGIIKSGTFDFKGYVSSWSSSKTVAKDIAIDVTEEGDIPVLFKMKNKQGASIAHISPYPSQKEVAMPTTDKLKVIKIDKARMNKYSDDYFYIITLEG